MISPRIAWIFFKFDKFPTTPTGETQKNHMWCKAGVNDMILHCAEFLSNDEVAHLVDSINLKLGMTPEACLRWRSIVMS